MNVSVSSLIVIVVCMVVAEILRVGIRRMVDLRGPAGIASAPAAGAGSSFWALVAPGLKRS